MKARRFDPVAVTNSYTRDRDRYARQQAERQRRQATARAQAPRARSAAAAAREAAVADTALRLITDLLARGLLAEDARVAAGDPHACAVCAAPIGRGQREARRGDGAWRHGPCVGRGTR